VPADIGISGFGPGIEMIGVAGGEVRYLNIIVDRRACLLQA
jgi:hypothetical protein